MNRNTRITPAESRARRQVSELGIDESSMLVVSNVFRVANMARNHFERSLLSKNGLTFSGFTVLWVLWVNGKMESGQLADESGVSKSTLTGIVKTLEKQSLVTRKPHAVDGRRVFVHPSRKGNALIKRLFPQFNAIERELTDDLSRTEKRDLIRSLRVMLHARDDVTD